MLRKGMHEGERSRFSRPLRLVGIAKRAIEKGTRTQSERQLDALKLKGCMGRYGYGPPQNYRLSEHVSTHPAESTDQTGLIMLYVTYSDVKGEGITLVEL